MPASATTPSREKTAPTTSSATKAEIPSTEAPAHYRGIQRYVHVVAHRFHVNFPGCDLGANIAIASDLPRASGMSSSSALTVGIALALIKRADLRERPEWYSHLRRTHD